MSQEKKLFVGICNSQEEIKAEYFWSILSLHNSYKISMSRSDHPWDVVRNNRLIKNFLDSDCDYFAKMDVDQSYPRDYFTKLVPYVEQYKVVGPLIFDRWINNGFIPLAFNSNRYPLTTSDLFNIEDKSGIVEIPYPHTNLIYHREVLEKIEPPWYEAFLSKDGLDRANHVDFSFLDKIHNAGFNIYINLDVVVNHLSLQQINREFYQRWKS